MSEGGDGGRVDSLWNITNLRQFRSISHYYGDPARQFLIGAAILMLAASPFYGDDLRKEFPFEVVGALLLVTFAALVNPRRMWLSIGSAIVSGVGAAVYATWGILGYESVELVAFILRVAISVLLLAAFYFSVKTVRAFMLHQIGKRETIDEFDSDEERARTDALEEEAIRRPDSI